KRDHGWKAKPGHAICVLDRGAVRFEFPRKWIVKQMPEAVQIHDCEPPDDNCVLEVSHFDAPAGSTDVPLKEVLAAATADDEREVLESKEVVVELRGELEAAWVEKRYINAETKREAFSRIAIARGSRVHCLITYDFWADQAARFAPVWNEVLR